MRTEYLRSVLRQEVAFFDNQSESSTTFQVVSTVSADAHLIQDTIAEKIPNILANLSSFMFCMPVAFILSWRLALAALPFSVMFMIPGVAFGKEVQKMGFKMKDAYGVAGGIAEQAISSIRTVFSYVGEQSTLEKFRTALERRTQLGVRQGLMKGLMIGSMGTIFATWAFMSWVGSVLVTERGENGGLVFVSSICAVLGGLSIMSALPNISFISEATIAIGRISKMIDRVPDIDNENEKGKVLGIIRGNIEFREVYFSYPSRPDHLVLQGFNLKVEAGKMVGLVGGSGSGKSTIISLLERFYDPLKGDILIDGNKLKNLQLKWLRSQMGLVNQEPILFATSIKDNILLGKEEASMDQLIKAAKAANAHDFIVKLPEGYDTHVGQFGLHLSGGQKQRISIARALIRNPTILLLDEATSALDAQSERTVQEALDQALVGRTTIIVAHRLSTIQKANLIVVLQSGIVVEIGSHDQLIKKENGRDGVYRNMVELQQSSMQNDASRSYTRQENTNISRIMSPLTPRILEPSYQSSPSNPFSPIYSMSVAQSSQMPHFNDCDGKRSKNHSSSASQWRLIKMNAPKWKQTMLGCLGAVGFGIVQPVYAYCLGTIVSVYFLKDNSKIKSETRFYCYIFLGLAASSFITNLLQHYNFGIMGEHLTKRVREKMLEKMLTFEIGWFDDDNNNSATLCARLENEANMVRSLISERMSLLVQVLVSATVAYVFGLVITWRIAIVVIAMQPLIIGSFYLRNVLMKNLSNKAQKAQSEGTQLACEVTINHRTITAFSSQKRILDLFQLTMKGPKKESIKQSWLSGFGLFSSQFSTTASIALTYWYGGRLINLNLVKPKHLFQAFFILMSTGKNIADAGSMTSDIAKGSNAIRSIFEILDRKSEIEPKDSKGVKKIIKGQIELKNVCFSYPSRLDQMIFRDLSLKIEAGRTVALVGQSGSGKSTVIGLIERFYDPLKGVVLIDECDLKLYNLRKLRSQIALVSQELTLFGGSIRENITYGFGNAPEVEVRKAAKLANAHEFISSLKDGYETYCGERGVQLSGGQKQRVSLARAILKNPKILLLDEATSALDSVSENLVQEAMEKLMIGRTCVVVAHRLSTIQKADSIIVIKNGTVAEQGSHTALLARGHRGAYYSMIKLQNNRSASL